MPEYRKEKKTREGGVISERNFVRETRTHACYEDLLYVQFILGKNCSKTLNRRAIYFYAKGM